MQPILDTELQKVCSEGSLLVASISLPPLHSHAFLGRTNLTGDFRQVFLLRARSGTKIKLSLFSFMDNQSIFQYSWEILPKKWVHKMKRSEHGNRSYTNTDYPFPHKDSKIHPELFIPPLLSNPRSN
ncbi:hypothetical protein PAHAL_4G164700 [Panicum hallii]|jgi:hypothetical protein|uniref:Uncharacterized protein n=1 Tax=Panicum hallii TaxID=206008 RepID=A0A2S3HJA3_9POAL|nr:hypothetical protein PAHAL_4G164700 [Panicum hallii]